MPLVAMKGETRFDISTNSNPRALRGIQGFVCPMCDGAMIVRAGDFVAAHFAHKNACTSTIGHHPESLEHNEAKSAIAKWLRVRPEYRGSEVILEYIFKQIDRRADIYVRYPNGVHEAHEIQFSRITPEELEARTGDYGKLGIETHWYFGGQADTQYNRAWCKENLGGYYQLLFEEVPGKRINLPRV